VQGTVHSFKQQQQQQCQQDNSIDDVVPQPSGSPQLRSREPLRTDSPEEELDAAGGAGPAGGLSSAVVDNRAAAADAGLSGSLVEVLALGIDRVCAGQIGAGLPVVVGGAGEGGGGVGEGLVGSSAAFFTLLSLHFTLYKPVLSTLCNRHNHEGGLFWT
jgi:hypothetical protein